MYLQTEIWRYGSIRAGGSFDMTNDELVKKVKELLDMDSDLDFLLGLKKKDLEKLVACIRGRLDQVSNNGRR
jgi:hypothetical protein